MIKLITFDLDNTLWEVAPVIIEAEKTMRAWLDERVPAYGEQVSQELMTTWRHSALEENPQLRYNISDLRVLLLTQALKHCGLAPAEAADLAQGAFSIFMIGRNSVEFYPQALPAIEKLGSRYLLAGLTNGNADISNMPLASHFEFNMSPEQVQSRKPEPEIFAATLRRAGCTPAEVIHVGDNLEEDVDGAMAAGWQTVWVNLTQEEPPQTPNYSAMVDCLSDLPAVIAELDRQA